MKIYTYAKCGTCRKAVKFLKEQGMEFQELPIRETPPLLSELELMLEAYGGEIRKLFNTSGRDYQALGLGAKLPDLSTSEALQLLARNGNLIKRPFLIADKAKIVGFNESIWREICK